MAFGRLERTQGTPPMSDINVTPLVDVMLVLVVIFILAAPLLASSIRLDLPRTDAAQPGQPAAFVTVVVERSGQVHLDEQPISLARLSEALAVQVARNPDTEVRLRADETVPYGKVVEIMGLAQKVGLNRIGFVVEPTVAGAAR